MIPQKKIVKALTLIMAIIGLLLLFFGVLLDVHWFIIILGGGFMISAYITYVSGMAHINEQLDKAKKEEISDENKNLF